MKNVLLMAVAVLMLVGVSQSEGAVITNSITDYSNTQGDNGWSYYYKQGAQPETAWVLAPNTGTKYFVGPAGWVDLYADRQRVQDGVAWHMKREWTGSVDYSAVGGIDVEVDYAFGGDIQALSIVWYDSSADVFDLVGSAASWVAPGNDDSGTLSFNVADFSTGDKIYASVNWATPGPYTGAYCHVDMTISAIPEPITMVLLGLGGLGLIRRRK